ncbi:unnamed protein product [Parascedosporium putredinis]|uniref:FAD-dependent urate hydroxylase HpyO/Asp monooxygenase CreE-like FAD/NAD(P)-binding domain-containing protein n=1 Tax=Parascedosporium putredinis TaxID=1442378 RepID=A0A9P1GU32_9PEZI|nr:unnamed protein product [Parascedosporium putredinis]CAI7987407.1 unnamed protein product [Parascedosporium putredinis]
MASRAFTISKIAIIGAGPSGITSAKYLLAQRAFASIVLFEQQPESAPAGVWHYTSAAPPAPQGPQTDPFTHPILPSRPEIIRDYVARYGQDVKHLVRYSREVVDLRPTLVDDGGRAAWDLTARSTLTGDRERHTFDAVVVANGHYSVPFIPHIPGLADFAAAHPGAALHSKQFRAPRAFEGQRVVVVGNGPSGLDIGYQIHRDARELFLSVRSPTPPEKLAHVGAEEIAEIAEFLPASRGVRLVDGRVIDAVDTVVFCTGFIFSYPFLRESIPGLITGGKGVHGLYRHLFCIEHPTLVFPGLLMRAVPFPVAEAQAAAFAAVWANALSLPPVEEQWKESKGLDDDLGDAIHVLPKMADAIYINELHDWVGTAKTKGKEPPRWGPFEFWQRKIFAEAKLAFERDGCKAKSLEELGFHFDQGAEGFAQESEP